MQSTQVSKTMIVYTANIAEPTDTMHKDIKSKNAELCIYDDISNTNIQHISRTGFISQLPVLFLDLFISQERKLGI